MSVGKEPSSFNGVETFTVLLSLISDSPVANGTSLFEKLH